MTKTTPRRPGPVAYLVATMLGTTCVVLIALRLTTYIAGIALGPDLNTLTFVTASATGVLATALFWRIDGQHRKADKVEAIRRARWTGYGEAARDIFDPPTGDDTLDLLRL